MSTSYNANVFTSKSNPVGGMISNDSNVNIFVPDLHSIISDVDGDLRENTIRTLKYYLAAGLWINENVHIYRQSYVPAHSELCWILDYPSDNAVGVTLVGFKVFEWDTSLLNEVVNFF